MAYYVETFDPLTGRRTSYTNQDNLKDAVYFYESGKFDENEVVTLSKRIGDFWATQFKTGAAANCQCVIIEAKGINVPAHKLTTFCIDDSTNPTSSCCGVYLRQFTA
jgi:hypothetical protein